MLPSCLLTSLSLFSVLALRVLRRNKLRSALTALGITIGVAAVVCVVAIGKAGSDLAEEQLQNLGDNLVWVEAGSRNVNGVRTGTKGATSLTMDDARAIEREVPLIKSVSPQADGNTIVAFGNRNWTTHYRGVSTEFLQIKRWTIVAGAGFTEEQQEEAASVCVVAQTVRGRLFGDTDPVGQQVRVQGLPFLVIGVLGEKGQSATGQDQDDTILMPYTTAQKKLKGRGVVWLDDILCSAVSRESVNPAVDQVSALMRQRHQIASGQDDDFNIRRPDELIKAQIEASQSMALLLASIATISLLVGGIGVMNVMLVSVTERTREIGLRMAVGARRSSIQVQFLGEAVMLSLLGGLFGVVLGVLSAFTLGYFLQWPVAIPPEALVVSPAFSVAVGIVFGFYPAWKASRMDPIEALRHE